MKYLFPDRNLVRVADVTADGVVPSTTIYETDLDEKQGSANVTLTGPYTGQHDTEIGIRIVDGDGDSSQVSQPVFVGVGTGTLNDLAVTGLPAQDLTITLEDLGTQTTAARAPFQGTILQAAPGIDGDLISITVDSSAIVQSALPIGTLHAGLVAGTNTYSGPQYDGFGAVQLGADGTIPDNAPRIRFGTNPAVFRAVKKFNFTTNAFDFIFSPTPTEDVDVGTNVYSITGSYFLTVTDGITPETYSGVVTCYDALIGFRASSALIVSIDPQPINDKGLNGQGSSDLSVFTSPYVLGVTADGTDFVKQADFAFAITDLAPTTTAGFTCIDDSSLGAEVWQVIDGVNIGLPNAVTGVPYVGGPYSALIPVQTPQSTTPGGNIAVDFTFMPRPDDAPQPSGRVVEAMLGALAQNISYTFTLVKKPSADCDEDHPTGEPRFECLGIQPQGGTAVASDRAIYRLQQLTALVRSLMKSNTAGIAAAVPNAGDDAVDRNGIDTVLTGANIVQACLAQIESGKLEYPPWAAAFDYGIDTVVNSVNGNGYRFKVAAPGTSGGSEPSWNLTVGATTTDGGVTWVNLGLMPFEYYDAFFAEFASEVGTIAGITAAPTFKTWAASTQTKLGDVYIPTTRNGHSYALAKVGVTGSSQPSPWPTDGGAVADGTAIWIDMGAYWLPGWPYFSVSKIFPGNGLSYTFTGSGNLVSDSTEPDWSTAVTDGSTVTDGAVTWTAAKRYEQSGAPPDQFFERWKTMAADVLAAAGITPTFSSAGNNGDDCWRDYADNANWFKNTDGPLLPFQQGHGYHSAKLVLDPLTGQLVPHTTEEFFIKLAFRCDLALGDSFTVTVSGVSGGTKAYRSGDIKNFAVVHADPLQFGGGQNGSDILTWNVGGSVSNFLPFLMLTTIPANRANSHAYVAGDKYKPVTPNAHWYICTVAGTSAGSAPSFPTNGSSYSDGTATFMDAGLIAGYSNNGLSFSITQGGIDFALGDGWSASIEGGHFQWNQDGGAFSSPIVIGTTVLVDGLSVNFVGGISPSYVAGDQWDFNADAVNGADHLKTPKDGRFSWIGSTTIAIDASGAADGVFIGDHTIPNTATIALQASNDGFVHTVVNEAIAWKERDIHHEFDLTTAAAWRLVITMGDTDPGSMLWLWLAERPQMRIFNGNNDIGTLTKNLRMPDALGTRSGIGYEAVYGRLGKPDYDGFLASVNDARINHDGRFGVVPNDLEDECGTVEADADSLQVKDFKDYQPRDITTSLGARRHGFTFTTNPIP